MDEQIPNAAEIEMLRQQAGAWELVYKALDEVAPGWANGIETGENCAVAAIKRLAALSQPAAAPPFPQSLNRCRQCGEVYYGVCRVGITGCPMTARAAQGGNAASGLSDWQLRDMGIDPSKRHNQGSVWPFPKPKVTP